MVKTDVFSESIILFYFYQRHLVMQVQHTTITPAGLENLLKSNLGKMEQFVGM